jgi:hypothetical protein
LRDITLGETVDFKFTTTEPDTGAPATLSGTPAISAYVGNSTTQITAGITLSVDFDGVTGLNNVRVVATSGNGYTDNTDVALIITTGTVDGNSAVGYKVAEFTIGRSAAYTRLGAPAGASVSADLATIDGNVDAILVDTGTTLQGELDGIQADTEDIQSRLPAALVGGRIDANVGAISGDSSAADNLETAFDDTAGAVPMLGIIDQGTAQSATATTLVLRSATPFSSDDACNGATLWAFGSDQGYWQARVITDYVTATDTATVATWDVTPSGTITYKVFGTAPQTSSGSGATAQEVWEYATRTLTALDEDSTTLDIDAAVRGAVGLASANLDTQLGDLPTAAENATAVWGAGARTLTALDEDSTTLDLDATVRAAVGLAAANLDTQLADLPTSSEFEARTIAAANYATATNLATVDTVVDGIKAVTDNLPDSGALTSLATAANLATVDTVVDAIKAKTDSLTFTNTGVVDANITHVISDPVQASSTKETNWGGTP